MQKRLQSFGVISRKTLVNHNRVAIWRMNNKGEKARPEIYQCSDELIGRKYAELEIRGQGCWQEK